ncbi:MAG TPA: exonuclease SbcCD subunit D [Gemmatimonadales bacterium]|nr:exonuclease SbcCD subunit D [Gemmatimonadales bacterium]
MKLAHLADAHLGFRQYYRQTSNGINQREADVANAFRRAIDGIIAARPDAVLIAGDLFHSVRPTNQAILFAFGELQRLRHALPDAPVVLIAGNHDTPRSTETGTILKLFETLGVDVVPDDARRLSYPRLDLSILAVPHGALFQVPRPDLEPAGPEKRQVLLIHGKHEGLPYAEHGMAEYSGALLTDLDLKRGNWNYVALGHYHVRMEVLPHVWYSGALDYVSSNPWGELKDENFRRVPGKGWLLVDVDSGKAEFQPVPGARRVMDLDPIQAAGMTATEIDAEIAERVAGISGGLTDQVARLVAYNVPRHLGRELNHAVIRTLKSQALHFQLDLRRPEYQREVGLGEGGRRQALPEIVTGYLTKHPLPPDLDRGTFVKLGLEVLAEAQGEAPER